jgi:hypothetical protein
VTSKEFTDAASDLCAWGQEEGVAVFVIHTTDSGNVRYIGPKLPTDLVVKMLRTAATGYETQQPEVKTLQ